MATADCIARRQREDGTIARAVRILEKRMKYEHDRPSLTSPEAARKYLRLRLERLEREEFWCAWLDATNRPIETECMSIGTITQTSVYPREIVRRAMHHNAAAVIFAHNHPSGCMTPSHADILLTKSLKAALDLVEVRVLDHFLIGSDPQPLSFAEHGLI